MGKLASRRNRRPRECVCPTTLGPLSIAAYPIHNGDNFGTMAFLSDCVLVNSDISAHFAFSVNGMPSPIMNVAVVAANAILVEIFDTPVLGDTVGLTVLPGADEIVGVNGEIVPAGDYVFGVIN